MKIDNAYFVDSILQKFMEKIPLDSFSEHYLRDHYICFSVVESIKSDYSVAVITEQNALNGFKEPEHKSSYAEINTNQRVYAADHPPYPSKEVIEEIHNRFGLTGWTVEEDLKNELNDD